MSLHHVLNKETLEGKQMLVVCPSRGRVEKLKKMLDSFYEKTSPSTTIIIGIDDDDPRIEEYKELLGVKTAYYISKRTTTTNIYNSIFKLFPEFQYYAQTNDDFVYLTAVWDIKLMENIVEQDGWGISYGDDRICDGKYPSHPIISGNIVRTLGWLQMPSLKHLCGDWVWGGLGQGLGRLYYDSNVIIKHEHPFDKKTIPDETYEYTNSKQMYELDHDAFERWRRFQAKDDIARILKAIFKEKKFDKTISLCMIIKQTENLENIKQCINSVKDWVDELSININYTNASNPFRTNDIKKLIKSYGIENTISVGRFSTFSDNRNITIKQATKDYCLCLDCDDVMPAAWTIKDIICRFPAMDVFLCHVISCNSHKGDEHITQSRLLKRHDWLEFRNNVHEDVSYSYKENDARVIKTDIIIKHLGNMKVEDIRKKNIRNYNLTLKEINTDKAHSLTYFAIVNELMLIGGKDKAIEAIGWIDKFFEKFPEDGKDPLTPKMWILRGVCALDCDQVDAARTNFAKAWHGWNHPEAAVMLAECHMLTQNWDKAIEVLEEIRKKDSFDVCNIPIDMHTIELSMLKKLGFAYCSKADSITALKKAAPNMYNEKAYEICQNCINEAMKCFESFLSIDLNNLDVGDKLAEIYRNQNRMNDSNAVSVSLINIFPKYAVGWLNLATFELVNGRYETAQVFFEKALKIDPENKLALHNLKMLKEAK